MGTCRSAECTNGSLAIHSSEPRPFPQVIQNILWAISEISINHRNDALTRSILTRTLNTVKELATTLDDLLIDEEATLLRLERLREMVKEEEQKSADLKDLIEGTRTSKGTMETVVQKLRSLLSPMKTLPTEVLIKIFSAAIEHAHQERRLEVFPWGQSDPDRTPLLLAQVCTRWRNIFSINPYLWNHITLLRTDAWHGTGSIEQFNHYARLGSSPHQSLYMPNWKEPTQTSLFSMLGGISTRYKSIEIATKKDPFGRWDIQFLNAEEVSIYRTSACLTTAYVTPLLQAASKVTIYGDPPHWGTVPWVTLQSLIIKQFCYVDQGDSTAITFTRDTFIQLLNATPSLSQLELDFQVNEPKVVWDGDDITMLHSGIKSLSIHLHQFVGGKGLFGLHLKLPALRTLELLSIYCESTPVTEVEILSTGMSPERLLLPPLKVYELALAAHVLHALPNIRRLDLRGSHSKPLLLPLHSGDDHMLPSATLVPVPKLKTLHLSNSDVDGETLSRFVQARFQLHETPDAGISAVEFIHMYNTPGVTVPDWNKIQEMLEGGRVANGTHSTTA